MARGWESKAIESQQQDGASTPKARAGAGPSPQQQAARERRRTLQLARARLTADLAASTAPAHKTMLQQAIAAIDEQLRAITALAD